MRTLTILISSGMLLTAETPKPLPQQIAASGNAPPKTAMLSESDTLKLENIQLRRQIANTTLAELGAALNALFLKNCQAIGGAGMGDCSVIEPTEGRPGFGVTLKPVAPITAAKK